MVVNELTGLPDEVTLVLDDYHLVEAAPVHHTLEVLLERGPPQLRLVLASRADPPLPLARLRARGQLAELRASDLRFTAEETTALLQEVVELELPAASLAALVARTEGWAAGLQLAALSLRGQTDRAGFVASFSGQPTSGSDPPPQPGPILTERAGRHLHCQPQGPGAGESAHDHPGRGRRRHHPGHPAGLQARRPGDRVPGHTGLTLDP